MTRLISLENLGLTYGTMESRVEAVRDISLTVNEGEFIAIIGPSGCGKSTLLRVLAKLKRPTQGRIVFDRASSNGMSNFVGMVFQAPVLLPWRSVMDNILMGAELAGLRREKYRVRAEELLRVTGLGEFGARMPRELSGGMQQRVSLCRALLLDPPLLLMDEPFGALDAMTRDEMNLELLRIWEQASGARKTIIFVTHSIPEALFLADRVVIMSARPGRIARVVDVHLARPRTVQQRATQEFGELSYLLYEELKVTHPGASNLL